MVAAKQCSKCRQVKLLDDFGYCAHHKDKSDSRCRECRKEDGRAYRASEGYIEKRRYQDVRRRYGLTTEEYEVLKEKYDNKCAICKTVLVERKNLAVDHCHDSHVVRGLLCKPCNIAIGNFKENIEFIKSAVRYLENANN